MGGKEVFKKRIRGRMILFLFILLAVLTAVFVHSMGEVTVMLLNGYYEVSEYPVRVMETMYTADMLDACVERQEKTPELLAADKKMSGLLAQEAIKAKGMLVLYTDDGEDPFKKAFDGGKSFRYSKEVGSLSESFALEEDEYDHLMHANYDAGDREDMLCVQMLRGRHTYFLCADVGGLYAGGDGDVFADGALGTILTYIFKIFAMSLSRLLFVYIAAVVLMFFLIGRTVATPIRRLEEAARSLTEMTKDEEDPTCWEYAPPRITTKDEIQSLAGTIDDLAGGLKQATIGLMKETAARERLHTELSLASNIQKNALNSVFPAFPDREDFDIIAMMKPAKEVGGDFYDFFLLDEDHLAFLIADVSSKGVPAALFMMQAKTLLRSGFVYSADIERIFATVNNRLCEGNEESMFVTCWMAVMELSTGLLSIVDAGHEPALLVRGGECSEIPTEGGLVLGVTEDYVYNMTSVTLERGDKVVLFTDGLNEAQNKDKELYGLERVEASVAEHGREDIVAMKDSVIADMDAFVGSADQFDDLTLLIFEYKKPKGEEIAAP